MIVAHKDKQERQHPLDINRSLVRQLQKSEGTI